MRFDAGHLIEQLPPAWRPYARLARLDKPIGTWLLLLPCWWSIALAASHWPNIGLMILFALGAIVMRGAGCTVNDLIDRDIDPLVVRTASRPIASGEITVPQAVMFLIAQLVIGFCILLCLNKFTVWFGVASLPLVFVYPLMKRLTWWPQLVLGLAFNWGALVGWSAVTSGFGLPTIPLYLAGIFWTLGYDTIYARQDIEDDERVGVKSSARALGEAVLPWVALFYAIAILFLMLTGVSADLNKPFFVILTGAGFYQAVQLALWQKHDPANCLTRFRSNRDFGLIVLAAIIAGKF